MAEIIAVLSGGSRDGESTVLDDHVDRLYAASDAPGMLDVYETTGETRPLAGNTEPATVFTFASPLTDPADSGNRELARR